MAAVTAAVVAGVATVAATGMQVASSQMGGGGGGAAAKPDIKQTPEDPQDRAMRDYYARLMVANVNQRYPAFSEYLKSGGDPTKAAFPLVTPELKPSEAAALGFVGGRGEAIPGVSTEDIAAGKVESLTPEQRIYLAKERAAMAAQAGQKPGPWAERMKKLGGKIGKLEHRLETLQAIPEAERRPGQIAKIPKIESRLEKLRGRQETVAGAGGT